MIKNTKNKIDIGLIWAKYMNIWSQIATVAGMISFIMMLGVFYTTTLQPAFNIPLWLYILIVLIGTALAIAFVTSIGISGYYRFFSERSELGKTNKTVQENSRQLKLIMEKLGITDSTRD